MYLRHSGHGLPLEICEICIRKAESFSTLPSYNQIISVISSLLDVKLNSRHYAFPFGGMADMTCSDRARIVNAGLTPKFAGMIEPSAMYSPS